MHFVLLKQWDMTVSYLSPKLIVFSAYGSSYGFFQSHLAVLIYLNITKYDLKIYADS